MAELNSLAGGNDYDNYRFKDGDASDGSVSKEEFRAYAEQNNFSDTLMMK